MKKIILVLFGIFFVLFTGGSLLICMITGIPSLDQTAAALYLVKAIVFSFGLPLIAFGFFAHNLHLRHKLEKRDQLIRDFQEKVLEHQKNSNCRDSRESYSPELKNSLACLFCAFAEKGKLSSKEQKELFDFIDKF